MPSEHKINGIPWVLVAALLIGIAIVVNDVSRLIVLSLAFVLPLLFYMSQKPLTLILKCMLAVIFFVPLQDLDSPYLSKLMNDVVMSFSPFQYYDLLKVLKAINPLSIFGIILGIGIFSRIARKRDPGDLRITAIDKLYAVFFLSAFISSLYAISVLGSLNWLFYSVVTGYIVYRAILTLDFQELKGVLRFLVPIASLSALYGIGEYIIGYSLIYGHSIPGRVTSLIGHPVVNGLVFGTVVPFGIAIYMETGKKIFIAATAFIFSAVILTFARGSWLALSVGLLVMLFCFRSRSKLKLFVTVIALAALLGAIPAVNQAIVKRLNESEIDRYSSFNIRRESFPISFSIVKDKPFFGGGPFNSIRNKEIYTIDSTLKKASLENSYLDFLVDVGLVGVGLLILLILTVLKTAIFSYSKDGGIKTYKVAAFASCVILLVNMATFNFDSYRIFHFVAWFYIGLNIVLSRYE